MTTKMKAMLLFAISLLLFSGETLATNVTFGDIASNSEENIVSFKSLLVNLSYLAGTALSLAGFYLFYKESKEEGRGHAKKGLFAVIIGVALLLLPIMIGVTANSTLGSSDGVQDSIETDKGF